MAPCTDYLFHVDGDSLFLNHQASLAPLVAQMQRANVDLLVGRDIIPQSPFNFGVFMVSWNPGREFCPQCLELQTLFMHFGCALPHVFGSAKMREIAHTCDSADPAACSCTLSLFAHAHLKPIQHF